MWFVTFMTKPSCYCSSTPRYQIHYPPQKPAFNSLPSSSFSTSHSLSLHSTMKFSWKTFSNSSNKQIKKSFKLFLLSNNGFSRRLSRQLKSLPFTTKHLHYLLHQDLPTRRTLDAHDKVQHISQRQRRRRHQQLLVFRPRRRREIRFRVREPHRLCRRHASWRAGFADQQVGEVQFIGGGISGSFSSFQWLLCL